MSVIISAFSSKKENDNLRRYDKFACFCKEQADQKQHWIEKGAEKDAALEARLTQATAEQGELDTAVGELEGEIGQLNQDTSDAQSARDAAVATYTQTRADLDKGMAGVDKVPMCGKS